MGWRVRVCHEGGFARALLITPLFLLSSVTFWALPVMAAASGFDILKHYSEFNDSDMLVLSVGFVVSFFVAYLTMKLFIKFLERFTFVSFGVYRIVFGLLLLLLL